MKVIRIKDIRERAEFKENISGSIAISKVRFVFKLFNINTEQEVLFLKSSRERRSTKTSDLYYLFEKYFKNPGLTYIEKINSTFNELFHSNQLIVTNENILAIFNNINDYVKKETEKTIKIKPGFYDLNELQKKIGYTFDQNTSKITMDKPYIMRPSSSKSLESHGDLYEVISKANILGKYNEINIHLNELNPKYSIDLPNKYLDPILYNLNITDNNGRFFGEIMLDKLTRLDFIPLRGEVNELNFSFTDCDGKPLKINTEVSIELLVD